MKIENEVLNVLSNARIEGSALKLIDQLDRSLYAKVNKVLEAAGGKWNRKAGTHLFDGEAADIMDRIILTGEIASLKTKAQQFDAFYSPPKVADRVIELAKIRPGMLTLEPNGGQGALAVRALDAGAVVMACELMPENVAILSKAIATHPNCGTSMIMQRDFLSVQPEPLYDRVVMNPPFSKQADIHHVNHALKFLKPDGLLVSVMSAGVSFRVNKLTSEFRDLIRERGGDIEALPEGSFKESGTGVNTVIVTIPGPSWR